MKRILFLLLAGCTAFSPLPLQNGPNPSATIKPVGLPAGVTVKSITVTPNPVEVALGQSQRLSVKLALSNGSTATDPLLVRFSLADPQAGVIDGQGLLTPRMPRMTKIIVEIGSLKTEVPLTITEAIFNWQQVDSPTRQNLYDAKMVSQTEAWAVGNSSTLLHLTNGVWQGSQPPVTDVELRGVDFSDPDLGWAVGKQADGKAAIWKYSGGRWTNFPTGFNGTLYAVDVIDPTHAWAVGKDPSGKVLIMSLNGSTWSRYTADSWPGTLKALHMVGSVGWAVGGDGDGLVLHYENNKWHEENFSPLDDLGSTITSSEFLGVQMVGDQVFAVGYTQGAVYTKGLIYKFDGKAGSLNPFEWHWSQLDRPSDEQVAYLDQVPLNGLFLTSGTQGWILGETIKPLDIGLVNPVFGNLLTWDGTTYRLDTKYRKSDLSSKFTAIDMMPSGEGVIVGTSGYLMQRKYDWAGS